jgi:hypothetical protein
MVKKIQVQAKLDWRIVMWKIHWQPFITGLMPSLLADQGLFTRKCRLVTDVVSG